jgi:hypothetical protein
MAEEKFKVDPETAETEFQKFLDGWDIDGDLESMREEDVNSFEDTKRVIIRAIRQGRAHISEDGNWVYTPQFTVDIEQITIRVPGPRAYAAMDKHKEKETFKKNLAVLSQATKLPPAVLLKIDGRDFKFAQAVIALFLG